jgi:hypothetical protein
MFRPTWRPSSGLQMLAIGDNTRCRAVWLDVEISSVYKTYVNTLYVVRSMQGGIRATRDGWYAGGCVVGVDVRWHSVGVTAPMYCWPAVFVYRGVLR